MKSFSIFNYLLVVFLLCNLFNSINAVTKTAKKFNDATHYELWSNASVWDLGVPVAGDQVIIALSGINMLATSMPDINVTSILSGSVTDPSVIVLLDIQGLSVSTNNNSFVTGVNSTTIFSNTTTPNPNTPKTITIGNLTSSYFDVYGNVIFDRGTTYTISGGHGVWLDTVVGSQTRGGVLENRGNLTVLNSDFIGASKSILYSIGKLNIQGTKNNYLQIDNTWLQGGSTTVFNSGSCIVTTYLEAGESSKLTSYNEIIAINSSVVITESSTLISYSNITASNSSVVITESSLLTMINPLFNFNQPNISNAIFLRAEIGGKLIIKDSTVNLNGAYLAILDNTLLSIEGSTFNTNYTIEAIGNAQIKLVNSELNTEGFTMFWDHTTFISRNSKFTIKDDYLGFWDTSVVNLFETDMEIVISGTGDVQDGILGMYDNSQFIFFENSSLYLDGVFSINDNALLAINSSRLTIMDEISLSGNSQVKGVNGSYIDIVGVVVCTNNSYLIMQDSEMIVRSNITMLGTSTFSYNNSNISVDGRFIFNNAELIKWISWMNNSKVDVNGYFVNAGLIKMFDSYLNVYLNFTTYGYLFSNNSYMIVEDGLFYIDGLFEGKYSTVQVNNGKVKVEDGSTFTCLSCEIRIVEGGFDQGIGSRINLTNTVFKNIGGRVQSSGVITLIGGGIANEGTFILQSDIVPEGNQTVSVTNSGTFTINGQNASNVNAPFTNNGYVRIDSNTTFNKFTQESGKIILNNSSLSSNQTIIIDNGDIEGNGLVNGTVENNQGTLGSKVDPNQITITGNYTQGGSGTVVVTLDSNSSSQLNITNNADFNGTLIIRVDEDLTNDQEALNSTTPVINFSSSNGTFQKIVIVTINKTTGKETVVDNDCKVKTQHTSTSFNVLVTPRDDREECIEKNNSQDTESNNSSPKLPQAAVIGIVVGAVGIVAIICIGYFVFHKTSSQSLRLKLSKLRNLTKK